MKLNQWAKEQTFSILRKLILTILMILLPCFIIIVYWTQHNHIQSLYFANGKSLLVAVQTGDLVELEKVLSGYSADKAIYSYELVDRDGNKLKSYLSPRSSTMFFENRFPIKSSSGVLWGYLNVTWLLQWYLFFYFILGGFAVAIIVTFLVYNHWKRFTTTLVESFEQIRYFLNHEEIPEFVFKIEELRVIFSSMQSLHLKTVEAEKLRSQLEKEHEIFNLSRRVVHDIRSPLSVLSLIFGISNFDEERKELVDSAFRRMNEICNDLLAEKKSIIQQNDNLSEVVTSVSKELQYRFSDKKLNLILDNNDFFEFKPDLEFKSVLSNLLVNAFESVSPLTGIVNLCLKRSSNGIVLSIKDNGCGIPSEIISQLGKKPLTYGKGSNGNGLGFYNAKIWSAKNDAEIKIESQLGSGTEILIEFSIC